MGDTLVAVGGAFLTGGLIARIGRKIGLPTIPFLLLAGIVCGPATPGIVLVEQPEDLELLAALGLVLLLFHLGLEFSLDDLVGGGRKLLTAGAVYLLLNVGGGLAFGFALGWGTGEALVVAGAVGISSSAIVTKLLVELRRLANPESRLILGIIVVEDIFLALYLALLQPVLGDSEGLGEAALEFGRALGLLLLLAAVARWGGRVVGRLVDDDDDELLTVCFIGVAVVVAGVAEELGVSEAIGAFMAGLILAESAVHDRIERLVLPLRDAFAALFFFAFGLTIDPADVGSVALPVAAAVVVTFVLNVAAGLIAARMHDYRRVPAANIGLTILGRGEFSLILATLALAAGPDERVGPFIAGYVLVLAFAGPLLASRSTTLARLIPARLVGETGPRPPAGARRHEGPFRRRRRRRRRTDQQDRLRAGAEVGSLAKGMVEGLLSGASMSRAELVHYVLALAYGASPEGWIAALEAMKGRPDAMLLLRQAGVRALVVVGELDRVTPIAEAMTLRSLLQGELVIVPNVGHLPSVEDPLAFNDALVAFLAG